MDFATKQNKSDNQATEASPVEEQSHSLAKDRIRDILRSSDHEHAAKSAVDEVVNSSESSSNFVDNKQSISPKSHVRDILHSSSAISIPKQTINNLENKYSADFSSVNFYQDDISTRSVNAKAYTYGTDVVLSSRHYKPNTTEGSKLLAHELAHVVQQDKTGVMQVQRDEAKPEETPADFNDSLDQILPKKTIKINGEDRKSSGGLLHHIFIVGILLDTFKDDKKIGALTRAIAADDDAKAVSQAYGICGIMALHDANIDAEKALKLLKEHKQFYSLDAIQKRSKNAPGKIIEETLTRVNSESDRGAKSEKVYDNIADDKIKANWALTLSTENLNNLKFLVPLLLQQQTIAVGGESRYAQSKNDLQAAVDKLKECEKEYRRTEVKGYSDASAMRLARDARNNLNSAKDNLALASTSGIKGLKSIFTSVCHEATKVSDIVKKWNEFRKSQKDLDPSQKKRYKPDFDAMDNIEYKLGRLKTKLKDDKHKFQDTDKSITRVSLIIRYFIALNDDKYDNAPKLSELKDHVDKFGEISSDFDKLIGKQSISQFDLYNQLAELIQKQVKTRMGMKKKLGADPGLQPSRENIEKYFSSMKKDSNQDVIAAYEAYAGGFFQHRVEAPKERVNPPTLDEVYSFPVTIGGARMVVCAGYAEIAAKLFKLSGADFKGFLIQGHLTDSEILDESSELTNFHIIARFKRNGKEFYVSNDEAHKSKKTAFAKEHFTIDSNKKYNKLESRGKTAKGAGDSLVKVIEKKREKLK